MQAREQAMLLLRAEHRRMSEACEAGQPALPNMHVVEQVLDLLHTAVVLSRGIDLVGEAMAAAGLGEAYDKLLCNQERAGVGAGPPGGRPVALACAAWSGAAGTQQCSHAATLSGCHPLIES